MRIGQNIFHIFLSAWVASFLAVACKSDHPTMLRQNTPQTTRDRRQETRAAELTVMIQPDNPDATSNLQAVSDYSGKGTVQYQWAQNGFPLQKEQDRILLNMNRFKKGDRITVTVMADGKTASADVNIRNTPPVVTAVRLEPQIIYRGIDVTAIPTAVDYDGDLVRFIYNWSINGEELSGHEAVLGGTMFQRGDHVSLTVIPYDTDGAGIPFSAPPITIPDAPPRFVTTPPMEFSGETYSYQAQAEDPDGDPLTYTLVTGPPGMAIDPKTGLITLQIQKDHAGTHQIEITAEDPQGLKASQIFSLTLTVP